MYLECGGLSNQLSVAANEPRNPPSYEVTTSGANTLSHQKFLVPLQYISRVNHHIIMQINKLLPLSSVALDDFRCPAPVCTCMGPDACGCRTRGAGCCHLLHSCPIHTNTMCSSLTLNVTPFTKQGQLFFAGTRVYSRNRYRYRYTRTRDVYSRNRYRYRYTRTRVRTRVPVHPWTHTRTRVREITCAMPY